MKLTGVLVVLWFVMIFGTICRDIEVYSVREVMRHFAAWVALFYTVRTANKILSKPLNNNQQKWKFKK